MVRTRRLGLAGAPVAVPSFPAGDTTSTIPSAPQPGAVVPKGHDMPTNTPSADPAQPGSASASSGSARDVRLTAAAAASLFVHDYGREARWVQEERTWYLCSKTTRPGYWSKENREGTLHRMLKLCQEVARDGLQVNLTARFMEDALRLARTQLATVPANFNRDPYL